MTADERQPESWGPMWILLGLLGRHRTLLIATSVAGILAQACAVGTACAGAWLVAKAILGSPLDQLGTGFVVLAICAPGRGILTWLQSWASHDYAFRVIAELRLRVFDGLEALAPNRLLHRRTGDLAATVMGDVERLEWLYAHVLPSAVVATVVPVAALTTLAMLSPLLALLVGVLTLLIASVPTWLTVRAHAQGNALRGQLGSLHADVVDGVQGLRELVSFGRGADYLARLDRRMRSLLGAHLAYGRRAGLEGAAADLLVATATVITVSLTAAMMAGGSLRPELFPSVVLLVAVVLVPVVTVVGTASAIGELRGCAARVVSVVAARPAVVERAHARTVPPDRLSPPVSFERVGFRYQPDLPDVLREVSFTVARDQTVALVGRSGAGKSTCVNLLMRFWDTDSGRITIGGVDVRDLTLESLRAAISLVPQDVYLFHGTVRDNISIARPDASDRDVRQAAERARAAEFIDALPMRYGTVIAERGLSLSGGQRQRIAIARAFLKDAPVLVLDEAVSNVDTTNERLVRLAVEELRRDRATLVIAHRLSTIRAADLIVMLDGGRVVERGSHADLLAAGGRYAQMIAGQRDDLVAQRAEGDD